MSLLLNLSIAAAFSLSQPVPPPPPGFAEADFVQWRDTREANLRKPDGWLALVGLVWLDPGKHTVGSGKDQHYELETGPERLGEIELVDGKIWFEPAADAGELLLDGQPLQGRVELRPDSQEKPSKLSFGDAHFVVIERSGKLGLRVRDASAPTLTGFTGNTRFDFDPGWVITADWEAFPEPQMLEVASVIGTIDLTPSPGKASFQFAGQRYTLQPTLEGDQLFFVFGDRTNGKQTYGMARYLYAKVTADGRHVVLDFNRSYNPPCAYTPYATCPLPTDGNRLDLAITAGELKYAGSAH